MFNKKYEERLSIWSSFRDSLEEADDPFRLLIDFYKQAPRVSIHTDPYDKDRWPTAWELVQENVYCDFCRVLAYYYSLQLTERFKDSKFEIHIITTVEEMYYLLIVNDLVLGYDEDQAIKKTELPQHLQPEIVYNLTLGQ